MDFNDLTYRRNDFYRRQYRRIMSLIVLLSVTAVGMTSYLVYRSFYPVQSDYYASTTKGQLIPLHSLDEPVVTHDFILDWSTNAVRSVYSLSFGNYNEALQSASHSFTPEAWSELEESFKSTGFIDSIKNNQLFVTSVSDGGAIILSEGPVRGYYQWVIQVPVLISLTSASEKTHMKKVVTMTVSRIPVMNAAKGIAITKFNVN